MQREIRYNSVGFFVQTCHSVLSFRYIFRLTICMLNVSDVNIPLSMHIQNQNNEWDNIEKVFKQGMQKHNKIRIWLSFY